ncbi:MAG TPA: hypothetical protein VG125_12810 [Pirellulales bacterium]|jgi:hypothetical protein|nr:hypothetical protein [Pirellulales bacterium]
MALRTAAALLLVAALTTASGCVPSEYPLSDEKTSKVDPQLVGRWVKDGRKNPAVLVVTEKAGQNCLEAKEGGEPGTTTIFTTTIGNLHYLSAMERYEEGEFGYYIMLYELVDNDTLSVYDLDPEIVAKAIADGQLAGIVGTERVGFIFTRVRRTAQLITDSREHLVAYLTKHGKDCFERTPITYRRKAE